jgi:FtsP/CotA-like multicopper oxidase with cupredoxin domain
MVTRRHLFGGMGAAIASAAVGRAALAALPEIVSSDRAGMQKPLMPPDGRPYRPVATLNGWTLPWRMRDGVKEFHLVAEPVVREIAPGMKANLWGYNGQSPGPTIEVVEGDRVRIFVTNRLSEATSIHWHGQRLPNGMDGVSISPRSSPARPSFTNSVRNGPARSCTTRTPTRPRKWPWA